MTTICAGAILFIVLVALSLCCSLLSFLTQCSLVVLGIILSLLLVVSCILYSSMRLFYCRQCNLQSFRICGSCTGTVNTFSRVPNPIFAKEIKAGPSAEPPRKQHSVITRQVPLICTIQLQDIQRKF